MDNERIDKEKEREEAIRFVARHYEPRSMRTPRGGALPPGTRFLVSVRLPVRVGWPWRQFSWL